MKTIKLFITMAAFLQLWGCTSHSQIKVGDKIPVFSLQDQSGQTIDIRNFLGKQPLVIYFYPKDDTRVCTKEACSFRDAYKDFLKYGAMVIGISADKVVSHKDFAARHHLPFTLLSDPGNKVRKLFGVPKNFVIPGRVTYVVNKKGVVIQVFNSMRDSDKHVTTALAALQQMQ